MIFLVLPWLIGGCTQNVRPPETFPTPVIQQLPLRVGLYQDRLFRNYVHQAASEMGRAWVVDLESIHKTLFKTVLSALFSEVIELENRPGTYRQPSGLQAIIEPQIQTFSLQTPSGSASPFYRASVAYLLTIYSPQGEPLGSWPVQGQGKGRSSWMQARRAVTGAVTDALRDVGVQIATELSEKRAIRDLLGSSRASQPSTEVPDAKAR